MNSIKLALAGILSLHQTPEQLCGLENVTQSLHWHSGEQGMSKISIFTQLQSNTSISGVGLCKIASAQKKKMHMNMTQKDVSFVQVDAAVTIKC